MAEISKPEPCAERKRLTAERLRELLRYEPATGEFVRRVDRRGYRAGTKAGSFNSKNGYIYIRVDGRNYMAHRLAWLYVTGSWPGAIDHANGNKTENRWTNLREATKSQNAANSKVRSDNSSGVKGVYWDVKQQRWCAFLTLDGKYKYLGRFASLEAAARIRSSAAREFFGEFART